ncbi:MAG: replication-associated recombination protein A [Clostridiales Family XIII bacterium]|jgi:putative ATPase|nr:replication-associated recombination protein A [Clostridiales Family XIII bacterium]
MDQQSLFQDMAYAPLAARVRPDTLEGYFGQQHLLGPGKALRQLIEGDRIPSMVFWGPPGVGKTTLARIIAKYTNAQFIDFSAVTSGIKEIRGVMEKAESNRFLGQKTILFVDEIHRFNKAQQDAFLPFVEKGSIILIGATTENPSFEINSALLSRCRVFVLYALAQEEIEALLKHAVAYLNENAAAGQRLEIEDRYLGMIAGFANGDARGALNTLEMIATNAAGTVIDDEVIGQFISRKFLLYDKGGEEHYNIISALHKSMRNSDAQAAVYWLARMLEGGEDPLYVARRVVRFASEDIGMADSEALKTAVAAYQACHFIGMPECSVHLTHAVVYCALAPKSNALYTAYGAAARDAQETMAEPVPLVIRNAPTRLMKDLGYGSGYQYAHNTADKITDMQCLPDNLAGHAYYRPTDQGREARVREWMAKLEALRGGDGTPP